MFLPLGDAPNPRGFPWVNAALIAANVAVFLLVTVPTSNQLADPSAPGYAEYFQIVTRHMDLATFNALNPRLSVYDLILWEHGYRPVAPSLESLFSSMFLHGSLLHLVGNMLFLWIYGDNVEQRLGHLPYLLAYLTCGVAATLAHGAMDATSPVPMVGASGAISGALGFYFVFFPRNTVRVLILLMPFYLTVVQIPARIVLGFYVIFDNLLPVFFVRGQGGIAYGAHLGGFAAGLGLSYLSGLREKQTPRGLRGVPADARSLRDSSQWPSDLAGHPAMSLELARDVFALPPAQLRQVPTADLVRLAEAVFEEDPRAALGFARRVLARNPRGSLAARAHFLAGRVQAEGLGRLVPAWNHYLLALEHDPQGPLAQKAREKMGAIEALQKGPLPRGLGR